MSHFHNWPQGGYHGRTFGAMSLTTSKTIYRNGFGPLMSGVFVAPFPYHIHGPISDPGDISTIHNGDGILVSYLLLYRTL